MRIKGIDRKKKSENFDCFVTETVNLISGKWKPFILWSVMDKGVVRFGELRKRLPDVTEKMLAQQLKELQKDGFLSRKVFRSVPPRVEYRLTDYGESFRPVINSIHEWGLANLAK
jgi:DNA-binding HxlR family transcriptional regulator